VGRNKQKQSITPLPVPRTVKVVLLCGGVFDPPHRAHVDLPRRVRDRLFGRAAWLVYVPAARSPHKLDGPIASDEDRVEMLRLATARVARCAIWRDEIDRGGASFWIDTLRRGTRALPAGVDLRFLIGSDQAVAFHRWKSFHEILGIAEPVVMLRPPHRHGEAVIREMKKAGVWSKTELEHWRAWIEESAVMELSSTEVREALRKGDVSGGALKEVPRAVLAYARRKGLYLAQ
jgi:nicotinate-nucleotide adenylyltransferase